MATRVTRLFEADIELVNRLTGNAEGLPFPAKVHAVLERLQEREAAQEALRAVLQEELKKLVEAS